jgi:hypothetical protein
VRKLPRWHRKPDTLPRTEINTQDSRLRIRAYRRIRKLAGRAVGAEGDLQIGHYFGSSPRG